MGSITHVTDEKGKLLNHYEYDSWGNLTLEDEQVSNRFKYTGEQLDPVTQQYYLRARFYNPALARFIQEDTYRGDGLNLYAYCANNPVRYVDPSGHWCEVKQNAYERLVKENGFDINNIDPDTKLRFMAEAANIVAGRNVGRGDTVIELPGLVLPEQNRLVEPGADVPNDGRRGVVEMESDTVTLIPTPIEPYNRRKHYGNTPTPQDRKVIGGSPDHDPPLVQRYYEGDPRTGEKPGYLMTADERRTSAKDRSRTKPSTREEQNKQGAAMAKYSKEMKKKFGL